MYSIRYENHEVYEFAAEELATNYAAITGEVLRRSTDPLPGLPVYLGSPAFIREVAGESVPTEKLRYDGYYLSVNRERIIASGNFPRSTLYGVYRLLENAGCKWMFPGPQGTILPHCPGLVFEDCEIIDNPDFEVRATTDDTKMAEIVDCFLTETFEKFDWAGKNRMNTYFTGANIHTGDMFLKPVILRELTKRGFRLEVGGHGTPGFVDRGLFEQKPELFREKDGVRRPDGNFCSSNPEAVQMVVDGVGRLRNLLPIDCMHLWFEDVFDGSWCSCEKCRKLTSAQQAMQVTRAVAEAYPDLAVDFILYHDTLDVSAITEKLPTNISAYYAPRERCYAHRLSDPDCARNRMYYEQVAHAHEVFDSIYPFEYYTDMILYNKMGTNFQRTIHEDMEDYKALGVNAFTLLMFNRYSWFAYKLPLVTVARHLWRLNTDYMALRREFCDTYFGNCADDMMAYYQKEEEFSDKLFAFCGYDDVHDIRNIIPLNKEYSEAHLAAIDTAEEDLATMQEILEGALKKAKDVTVRYLLNSETELLTLTRETAAITHAFMDARHQKAFCGMADGEFDGIMDRLIARQETLGKAGLSLPDSLIGINGKTTLPDHLCGDLNTFYRSLKSKEEAKDFKTF